MERKIPNMIESKSIKSYISTVRQKIATLTVWQKIVTVVLIVGLVVLCVRLVKPANSTESQYQTATVEETNLVSSLSVTGNIVMGSQFGVSSSVTGVVDDVYVKNGDEVKAGQALFKVTSTASPQEKASAYASYLNAKNSLQSAEQNKASLDVSMWSAQQAVLKAEDDVNNMESNLDDYTDLARQAVYSARVQAHKAYDLAEEKFKTSETGVTSSKASLNSSLLAYQATQNATITAPSTGMIANLAIQKGDAVTASNNSTTSNGTTTSTSTTAMYVTNFKDVVMKAAVNEVDLPKVKVGQKATISLDAFSDQTFVGTVNRIDMIGTNSSNVVTFNVYISLLSPPEGVGSGMTASGSIQLDSRESVLSVPSSAITTTSGASTVRVLTNDGTVDVRAVETGLVTDTETEVTSGLQAGDTVITGSTSPTTKATTTTNGSTGAARSGGNSVFSGGTGAGFRTIGGGGPR